MDNTAQAVQTQIYRAMDPTRKLRAVFEMFEFALLGWKQPRRAWCLFGVSCRKRWLASKSLKEQKREHAGWHSHHQ
jgi:hypothetical protein